MLNIITDPAIARQLVIDQVAPTVDPVLDTSMAAAVKALGAITVVSRPTDGDTLTVGGKVYSFVSSGPTGDQILSSASNNTTAANILAKINTDTAATLCTATRNNAVIVLTANTAGIAGNSIDLESSASHITVIAFSAGAAAVTEDDISRVLDKSKQAVLWAASTAFTIGDVMVPVTRVGVRFRCIQSGTTGATEPTWSVSQPPIVWRDSIFRDGTVVWREDGIEFSLWDIRRACYLAWDLKVQKASACYSFKAGDMSFDINEKKKELKAERDRFTPVVIA